MRSNRYFQNILIVNKTKIKFCFGLILFAFSLALLIKLMTYSSFEKSIFYFDSDQLVNDKFLILSNVSALLFYYFGYGAFFCVVFLFYLSNLILFSCNIKFEWERICAFIILIFSVSMIFAKNKLSFFEINQSGGVIGHILLKRFLYFFDKNIILFFLCSLMLVCLIIILRFSNLLMIPINRFLAYINKVNLFIFIKKINEFICKFIFFAKKIRKFIYECFIPNELVEKSCFQVEYEHLLGNDEKILLDDSFWIERTVKLSNPNNLEIQELKVDINIKTDLSMKRVYQLPDIKRIFIAKEVTENKKVLNQAHEQAKILEEKLKCFGIHGTIISIEFGPVVTLFEYEPQIDTKISKIISLEDDLAMALQTMSIRIIAPIPGKSVVGFEIANKIRKTVFFAPIINDATYTNSNFSLPLILGEDVIGNNVIIDLVKMPHLLVAGSTGSGKSVALSAMIISLICKSNPDDLKLILIDPKRLEFTPFADIAHLLFPIVTSPQQSNNVLKWLVKEMENRYELMSKVGAKNILDFNKNYEQNNNSKLPFIVLIIDELADLMMTGGKEIEDSIIRIAQMARACGIHMIIATQRPSVDVVTGLIKVNFPSRISFKVVSKIDSRTILDSVGADKLLSKGDMLFLDSQNSNLKRVHGAYISDKEILEVVEHIKNQRQVNYVELSEIFLNSKLTNINNEDEELFKEIINFINNIDEVSISLLQRKFRIGYNRSARIIEMLENQGYILPSDGAKPRKVNK